MSETGQRSGFWAEGRQRFEAGLREAEDRELTKLTTRLAAVEDPAARARLLAEIEEVKARYREERRALLHSMFATAEDAP